MAESRPSNVLRVGRRAQIVLPAAIRRKLHIVEGDLLAAAVSEDGRIVLTPVPEDPFERFRNAARPYFEGVDPVAYQRESRADDDSA